MVAVDEGGGGGGGGGACACFFDANHNTSNSTGVSALCISSSISAIRESVGP